MSTLLNKKSYFTTDYDETLLPGEQLMDLQLMDRILNTRMEKWVRITCEHSTGAYLEELKRQRESLTNAKVRLQNDGEIYTPEWEEIKKELQHLDNVLFPEHYRCKDIVREEIYSEFVGLIDYAKIYVPENLYPGVRATLWAIYNTGIYHVMAGNSQTNSTSEEAAKDFLSGILPPMERFYVRFHEKPYFNPDGTKNTKRIATDKWQAFVDAHPDMNVEMSSVVENSPAAYNSASSLGFKATLVPNERCLAGSHLPCEAYVYAANQMIAMNYPNRERLDAKRLIKQ